MEPITILIVDDHAVFRNACSRMLQENKLFHVLACTGNADEALRISRESRPDITLLDIRMPVSGFELARQIKQQDPHSKIIGLSLHADLYVIRQLILCGASGYVTKGSSIEALSEAIIRVHNGEKYFSSDLCGPNTE